MRCEKRFCRYGSCDGCTLTEISLDWAGRLMMGLARAGDGFADGKTAPPPEEMGGGAGAIGD